MNAKKAKQLRKIAQAKTTGSPAIQYEELGPTWVGLAPRQARHLGHVQMVATCTRAVYQQLKRAH